MEMSQIHGNIKDSSWLDLQQQMQCSSFVETSKPLTKSKIYRTNPGIYQLANTIKIQHLEPNIPSRRVRLGLSCSDSFCSAKYILADVIPNSVEYYTYSTD